MQPKVFIATPTAGGVVKTCYANSIAGLVANLERSGIHTMYADAIGVSVAEQRDLLAHAFLASDCTHLLFVDSDMRFPADLAARLLSHDRPMVAAPCARRSIDLERARKSEALAYQFAVTPLPEDRPIGADGLVEVRFVGFGFALLRRDCLEATGKAPGIRSRLHTSARVRMLGFFEQTENGAEILSEDYSFCERWRSVGGQVLIDVATSIQHVGDFAYGVPYADFLRAAEQA